MNANDQTTCPDPEVFVEFLTGRLTDEELKRLEEHLAQCAACGDTVRSLHIEDTFVDLVRLTEHDPTVDSSADTEMRALLEKLESLADSHVGIDDSQQVTSEDLQARVRDVQTLLAPPESEDELGRLAHYRVLKLLGAGGMGVVYQAEDTRLERLVALKILRPSLGRAARERFLQEARAAAAIDHDNVVTIYNVGSEGPLAYLAMQWLEGETLEARLNRDGRLSPEEVIEFGSQIADGLAAAHAKKRIHRDIKPANILIEAGRNRAKILDFGLAQVVDDNPQLTETGMIAGTPAYMSPEQAQGRAVDERSDLFSLGTMLYRMLTGDLPFHATNALATIRAIQQDTPAAPRQVDLSVPSVLSDLVTDLLEKDPRHRPESAEAVADALCGRTRPARQASKGHLVHPQTSADGRRNWKVLLPMMVAFGGLLASPMVYRILTDYGEIVVKTDDPNVKVEVLQAGNLVKVIDPSSNDTVTIDSGTYQLQLKNASSEVTVQPNQVTLRRHGREVVTVSKTESARAETAGTARTDTLATSPPRSVDLTTELSTSPDVVAAPRLFISPGDRVHIQADGVMPDAPINGVFLVEASGKVALGPQYGRFQIRGMTFEQAEEAIEKQLKVRFADPHVQVTLPIAAQESANTFNSEITRLQLKYIRATDASNYYQRFFPDSPLDVVPDIRTNSLLVVNGSPAVIEKLARFVEKIDTPKAPGEVELTSDGKTMMTYDGKPYSHWIEALRVERNPNRVAEGLKALAALTDESHSESTCQAVFRAMRDLRSNAGSTVFYAAQSAILNCDPKHVMRQTIDELRGGNQWSRNLIHRLWLAVFDDSPGGSTHYRQAKANLLDALARNSRVICEHLLQLTEDDATREWANQWLARYGSKVDMDAATAYFMVPNLQPLLKDEDEDLQLMAAGALARLAPDTEGLTELMLEIIETERTTERRSFKSKNARSIRAINVLKVLGPRAHAATPTLLEILPELNIRAAADLIEALGEIGPAAQTALPTLRKFVEESVNDQGFGTTKAASKAIEKIEQGSSSEDAKGQSKTSEEAFGFFIGQSR